jgi:hypothetical protein
VQNTARQEEGSSSDNWGWKGNISRAKNGKEESANKHKLKVFSIFLENK